MKRSLITRFCKDERGVVAVVTALIMVVIISFAALAIDVGKVFTDRRVA
jgi:Flp pilus assembly protein TadG